MTNKFLLDLTKPIFSNSFIGFDALFNDLYRMQHVDRASGYPPYNMTKNDIRNNNSRDNLLLLFFFSKSDFCK